MFPKNIGVGLDTLIPISIRCYQSIIDSSEVFFSSVNSVPNVDVCNVVWYFYDHVVGVDPTTENNPMIDITAEFLCPCPETQTHEFPIHQEKVQENSHQSPH